MNLRNKKIRSYKINFGPQHPSAHGVLRLLVLLKSEVVLSVDPHIGLLHRGTEKLIESKNYIQALPYLDRLDYVSIIAQEHAFSIAVEKLLDIEVPTRTSYLRVIFLEITRILNHLLAVTTHAIDIGALTPFLWGFEEREKLIEFYERASGARMHANYIRPGGVSKDCTLSLLADIWEFAPTFKSRTLEIEEILTSNRIFKRRTVNVGVITKEQVQRWGLSGVIARGSGIQWDLRKTAPYEVYDEILFNVPIGMNGDCFDRFLVRIYEIRESCDIIEETSLFTGIDEDAEFSKILDNKIVPPERGLIKDDIESLIAHFKYYSDGFKVPPGEVYLPVEAPKGEFGVILTADGTPKPYRCKLKAPGFSHLQACKLFAGQSLSDIVTIIGTLDIVFGEVDR